MPGKQCSAPEKQNSCPSLLGFVNKTWALLVSLMKPRPPCFHLVLHTQNLSLVAKGMCPVPDL
jgi:hypothetical protein